MLKCALSILVAVALFFPVGTRLYSSNQITTAEREHASQLFVNPTECRPEPAERLTFVAGVLIIPALVMVMSFALDRVARLGPTRRASKEAGILTLVVAVFLSVFAYYCLLTNDFFHIRQSVFFRSPIITTPLFIGSLLALRWRWDRAWQIYTLSGISVGLVLLVVAACVFDEGGDYCRNWHFAAVFNSVVQVDFGKALLVDCRGQYGLYPHLLQPIFAVTGLSVVSFTLVMALLLGVAYIALWSVTNQAIQNRLIAFFGFLALVFTSWFYLRFSKDGQFQWVDFYFQYHPIRFLFPALLVWCAWRYFRSPTRRLYWTTTILTSVGVLWNFDSGLPALLTWLASLCFAELYQCDWLPALRRWLAHIGACLTIFAAVVILYIIATYCHYGAVPDFAEFFRFQKLFYLSGFFMLPMEFPATWILVVLVYLGGLAYAAGNLASIKGLSIPPQPEESARPKLVFLLSLLGLGLFSYYQGRSHEYVLTLVWWPCFVLLALFSDDVLSIIRRREHTLAHVLAFSIVAWLLIGCSWSAIADIGCIKTLIAQQFPWRLNATAAQAHREADSLRAFATDGERMVFLAPSEPVLHLISGVPPIAPCSYIEMVLLDDYTELLQRLEREPAAKVYIDKGVLGWHWRRVGSRHLINAIQQKYLLCGETPAGYVFQRGEHVFRDRGKALAHLGFHTGDFPAAMETPPISIENDFTIEMIVNPDAVQKPWRVVLSNHCGSPAHQGMMIFESSSNQYELICGTGEAWEHVAQFQLPPGRWNYVAISREGDRFRVYQDGKMVDQVDGVAWTFKNGTSPLIIGDWVNRDCPFLGRIREIRILDRAATEDEIHDSAARFACLLNHSREASVTRR